VNGAGGRAPIDLAYILTRYPIAQETFVTGEIRFVAPLVRSLGVIGLARTAERDIRPGGIPDDAEVGWVPRAGEAEFWAGNATVAARHPGWYAGLLSVAARRGLAGNSRLRWAHRSLGVAALARRPDARRPTHLHAHFAAHGAVAAWLLSRRWGVPFSVTVHAYDIFQPNRYLERLVRDASVVVAISEFDRRHVLDAVPGANPDRIVVVHAGVPVADLAALGPAEPSRKSAEPHTVVSVGRLVAKKGMDVLIEAVGRLPRDMPIRCEIIGEGPQRGELEAMIAARGLRDRVLLGGAMTPDETRRRVAAASLFVLASRRAPSGDMDGIPVALMEAMACGTPAISTTVSAIPELIVDGRSGRLVGPNDPDALAAAIADALGSPQRLESWRAEASRTVAAGFDQATNARATLDAILRARGARPLRG
jgi:colanic acid/amylovoran biosynthesis glycosyltransferase